MLARSESKTTAVVEICAHEHLNLAERMRMLVLCDHERAGATLPADLDGVIDQQAGSAHAVLTALVAAPETSGLDPMLVTGRTVAGSAAGVIRMCRHRTIDPSNTCGLPSNSFFSASSVPCCLRNLSHFIWAVTSARNTASVSIVEDMANLVQLLTGSIKPLPLAS